MLFDIAIEDQNLNEEHKRINRREAIRAVVARGNSMLLVHCSKGDYKLPGGGVKSGESHAQTLKREVEEETGYIISCIGDMAGKVVQRNIDNYDSSAIFEMISYYYICSVYDERISQSLDEYEKKLGFEPVWISLKEAAVHNERILEDKTVFKNPWVQRETMVMKRLLELTK